ncbi:hypothetical protein SAMD00019534_013690 [Acytostelium subglobosum LB1]|uniref:hypothetical protein n=1 Tax=Acytostelium subglobosum LB1 TaxID=1410327 RepID=UPI00064520BF|nr:hypothetical protein SAMD00019534_013690 [Acytostelium subglobosum LB1]GAM18194.1 hypothetical protein SAMD00019534_013690 [Acytostelium subglobosum LB1]|eukprot:XP_012758790.1 hypothetical protein SAMD00019534_013690 [Acytostelium subglobosum LB1]
MITVTVTVNGQDVIITTTIYVDQTSTNTSTICGLGYQDPNMACPNITSAINSYRSIYQQQLHNTALNIAMAGGVYPALKGNSDLNLLYINVTIGPSPYTQCDVIIDLVPALPNDTFLVFFFNSLSDIICNPQINITLNIFLTQCKLTINQTEFIGNNVYTLLNHSDEPLSIIGATFRDNFLPGYLFQTFLETTTPMSIVNTSFIGNTGIGES